MSGVHDERPSPGQAVRLLRAKASELESLVINAEHSYEPVTADFLQLAADIALVAELLADHIERASAR